MDEGSAAMLAAMRAKPNYSGEPLSAQPAFEFITSDGRYYAIFADGRVEGVAALEARMVINRIPMMINAAVMARATQ